jgi:pilus assembly protein Flp/PilA
MKNLLSKLQRDEDGAAMVEYAVILGLVTAAVIATITLIGGNVGTILTKVNTALAAAAA